MSLYFCHTGVVRDSTGGGSRIVRSVDLPRLYGVSESLCTMINSLKDIRGYDNNYLEQVVHLFPRSSGDYSWIPKMGEVENEQ